MTEFLSGVNQPTVTQVTKAKEGRDFRKVFKCSKKVQGGNEKSSCCGDKKEKN